MTGAAAEGPAPVPADDVVSALVGAGRSLVAAGLSPGSSGNLSVVDDRGCLVMSGTGTSLGALTAQDLAVLDDQGRHLGGARPSKEVALHCAMLAKNPGHAAVVHVHSPSAVAVSCLEPWSAHNAIPPLTPYSLMRIGQVPLLDFVAPGDAAMGDLVRDDPRPFHGALLANHGAVVSGETLGAAVTAAVELEEACRIALLTEGRVRRLIPAEQVVAMTTSWGTPWTGPADGSH